MVESSKHTTSAERRSDREVVVRRIFDAPVRIVWDAWTRAELFSRWWVPKSSGLKLQSFEQDVRVGGGYRVVFDLGDSKTAAFFGKYLEVQAPSRLSWTNEESEDGAITTITLEEKDGKTHLTLSELYASKEALDRNFGSTEGLPEQFGQLDALLPTLV